MLLTYRVRYNIMTVHSRWKHVHQMSYNSEIRVHFFRILYYFDSLEICTIEH